MLPSDDAAGKNRDDRVTSMLEAQWHSFLSVHVESRMVALIKIS